MENKEKQVKQKVIQKKKFTQERVSPKLTKHS